MPATVPYCIPGTKWNYHTPNDGSGIGGNQPTGWKLQQLPDGSVYLEITGTNYADIEFYATLPTIPEEFTGYLIHEFDITPDANPEFVQAREFDSILTYQGYTYENQGSLQLNYSEGGNLQITNGAGQWVDIGDNSGIFTPNQPTHIKIVYSFNLQNHTGGAVGISLNNGSLFSIPSAFQNQASQSKKWNDCLFVQFQLDTNKVGGTFGETISNGKYTWA
jgi:hypothetical protein